VISSVFIDVCNHCNKKYSQKGEVLQCDLCGHWVHASCEGIKRDQYRQLSQLASSLQNIYYCKLNECANRVKLIVGEWIHSKAEDSDAETSNSLKNEQEAINASIQTITTKIQKLNNTSTELSTKVDKLQEQFHTTQTTVPTSQSSNVRDASSAAMKAIEEIADRERRKNNIIVYNLIEGETKEADKDSALVLLNYILDGI